MRWIRFVIIVLVCTIVQASFLGYIALSPLQIKPDLLLILMVFFSLSCETTDAVISFGEALIAQRILPKKAATDALHIAVATVHGIDLLLTWNCAHLANAELLGDVAMLALSAGYEPPVICTPDELLGE